MTMDDNQSGNTPKTHKRKAPKTAWAPGKSGNPAGRPKATEAQRLARELRAGAQPELVRTLLAIANDVSQEAKDRIAAAKALLEDMPVEIEGAASDGALVIKVVKLGGDT